MIDKLFHQFLLDGGQVSHSARSGSIVILPDHWWDLRSKDELTEVKANILSQALACKEFPSFSVVEVADQLRIPYRHVLELIRFQHLGTLKRSGIIQIYQPSLSRHIDKLTEAKPCWLQI